MNAVTETKAETPMVTNDPMLALIERVMLAPDLPAERIQLMMDVRERQLDKEAEQAFNVAFAAAMAEMPDVPKSGEGHNRRRYSTLDDLIRTTRPILSRHGLSLNWETGEDGQLIEVTANVRHALGHKVSTTRTGPRDNGRGRAGPLQSRAGDGGMSNAIATKRSISDLRDELAATYAENHARADLIDKLINDCAQSAEYHDALKAIARTQSLHHAQTVALTALGGKA